ncbi:MAG: mechanosensitive ion channel family protein [Firmicutes bacterium]|nr:mechanosensitive ion channel family protein [Bacillota bacterium]
MGSLLALGTGASILFMIIKAVLILLIGYIVINLVTGAVKKSLEKNPKIDPMLHGFLVKVLRILLWVVVIVMLLQAFGVNTASLVAIIGAAGIAVAMALKDSLANVAGGILILINKPFKRGDEIEVAGQTGIVDAIDIMTTQLHTWDNKIVRVPNGAIVTSSVVNFTESGLRRVEESFGVAPDSDFEKVKAAIRAACAKDPVFSMNPEPVIGASGNGDGSVIFDCKVWVKTEDYYGAIYRLREGVAAEFAAAGVSGPKKTLRVMQVE